MLFASVESTRPREQTSLAGKVTSRDATRRRAGFLSVEIMRLAEALHQQDELVGADHIRSIARLFSWL
jgi:hypothetical protein